MEQKSTKKRSRRKKKMEFGKLCFLMIVANCTVIELYSMIAMWHFGDLSALYSLIGAVVGESIAYVSYCAKAKKETFRLAVISLLSWRTEPLQRFRGFLYCSSSGSVSLIFRNSE